MLEITWLGHGTFQFRLERGEVLAMDPWIDGNPACPQGHSFSRIDALLITHGHFDHMHDEAALACRLLEPRKVIPMHFGTFPPLTGRPEELARLIQDLPATEVWALEPGRPVTWLRRLPAHPPRRWRRC